MNELNSFLYFNNHKLTFKRYMNEFCELFFLVLEAWILQTLPNLF